MYRQGDVMLVAVEEIPPDAKKQRTKGRVVLAEGEATGHAHTISADDAALFVKEVEMYIRIGQPTALTHQEHAPILLPPGNYKVVRQREYSPGETRRVAD